MALPWCAAARAVLLAAGPWGCALAQATRPAPPTLDEKLGQMLMVGFQGLTLDASPHVRRDIVQHGIGGVVLFDVHVPDRAQPRNVSSPEQLRALTRALQGAARTPLFIAVDQEGGRVARLREERGFAAHRSAQALGQVDHPDTTAADARRMAAQLRALGFTVNFAPVVDLNSNPENPVIGRLGRSFGADPALVTRHAAAFLDAFRAEGVLGVLKHFPGHGSSRADSHVGMADVTATWDSTELEPYRRLRASGRPFGVMTAHVFHRGLDPAYPATLSRAIQTGILRERLGFDGVLFSDDLQMEAIRAFYGLDVAIRQAVLAGVDVLVFANNSVYEPDIVPRALAILRSLVAEGVLDESRVDASYRRILAAKAGLGIR